LKIKIFNKNNKKYHKFKIKEAIKINNKYNKKKKLALKMLTKMKMRRNKIKNKFLIYLKTNIKVLQLLLDKELLLIIYKINQHAKHKITIKINKLSTINLSHNLIVINKHPKNNNILINKT